jgi:uncharacterized membrane protein
MNRNKGKPPQAQRSHSQSSPQITTMEYSGPLPPAAEMGRFEEILPGAAERILAMAESSQKHTQEMEYDALHSLRKEVRRGQYLGILVTMSAFFTSGYMASIGQPEVAGIIGGTTVVSIAVAFVLGRKNN